MKRKIAAAAVLLAALALVGCSAISAGTITGKSEIPAYVTITYCGKGCFMPIYYPERWRFDLRDKDATGWVYVDEQTYTEYEAGDHYPRSR